MPAWVGVRALLDPIEQVDERFLRVPLTGEAALALAPSASRPGGEPGLEYQVPWLRPLNLRVVSAPSGLPAALVQPHRLYVEPASPVLSMVRFWVGQ